MSCVQSYSILWVLLVVVLRLRFKGSFHAQVLKSRSTTGVIHLLSGTIAYNLVSCNSVFFYTSCHWFDSGALKMR